MHIEFKKRFQTYRDATLWCHERHYSPAVKFVDHKKECTITLEGDEAKRAIEEETKAKAIVAEAQS